MIFSLSEDILNGLIKALIKLRSHKYIKLMRKPIYDLIEDFIMEKYSIDPCESFYGRRRRKFDTEKILNLYSIILADLDLVNTERLPKYLDEKINQITEKAYDKIIFKYSFTTYTTIIIPLNIPKKCPFKVDNYLYTDAGCCDYYIQRLNGDYSDKILDILPGGKAAWEGHTNLMY